MLNHKELKAIDAPKRQGPAAEETAARLGAQRIHERQSAFHAAKERHDQLARRSGAYLLGRDENGAAKETKNIEEFGIFQDKWYVTMSFRREDVKKLQEQTWGVIEAILKRGAVPRRPVRITTHIITAVRMLKHIREGYAAEISNTDGVLGVLDLLNARLAKKGWHSDAEIDTVISQLEHFDETVLAGKHVALKRIVARMRLTKAIKMLEEAKASDKRDFKIGAACAVFTSVRARIGEWRDRQIAGLSEYNHQKEYALRIKRDEWLFSQLAKFVEIPQQVYEHVVCDSHKLEVLSEIQKMLDIGAPSESMLRYISANSKLFRVTERERAGAEERIAAVEAGGALQPEAKKVDYLIGYYAWLYRYVRNGDKERAKAKLDHLAIFVNANKPRYILEELKKTNDSYALPIIESLDSALSAFEAQDFARAKTHFEAARDRLRMIMQPGAQA